MAREEEVESEGEEPLRDGDGEEGMQAPEAGKRGQGHPGGGNGAGAAEAEGAGDGAASFAFEWPAWLGGDSGLGRLRLGDGGRGGGAGAVGVCRGFQGVPTLQVGAHIAD